MWQQALASSECRFECRARENIVCVSHLEEIMECMLMHEGTCSKGGQARRWSNSAQVAAPKPVRGRRRSKPTTWAVAFAKGQATFITFLIKGMSVLWLNTKNIIRAGLCSMSSDELPHALILQMKITNKNCQISTVSVSLIIFAWQQTCEEH